jgi:hypothetical protein
MIVVTTIRDNVVENMFSFIDKKMAEKIFSDLVQFYGGEQTPWDIEQFLDDGYFDGPEVSVCLTHPDSDYNNDFLKDIREKI